MPAATILTTRDVLTLPRLIPMIGADRAAGKRVKLLVPEQYTLQAEREIIDRMRLDGLLDIDVLSPTRLAKLIYERAGAPAVRPLGERGRAMACCKALLRLDESLSYYRHSARQPGLADTLAEQIADMKDAGLLPDQLTEPYIDDKPIATRDKLRDLRRIWEEYDGIVAAGFMSPEETRLDSLRRLGISGIFCGSCLYVCGFDYIRVETAQLICDIAPACEAVTVILTSDVSQADAAVFSGQEFSASRLDAMLRERGIASVTRRLDPSERRRDPALDRLAAQIFVPGSQPWAGVTEAVAYHTASNPDEEAACAASVLSAWHREGIPWSRMAVAVQGGGSLLEQTVLTLDAADIPCFAARRDSMARHGLCRALMYSVRAVCEAYRPEDMLNLIKSGFAPFTEEEALRLENYLAENGIRGAKWKKPFTRGSNAPEAEALRCRLMKPLLRFADRLRLAGSAAQSVDALYELLLEMDAYAMLLRREQELLRQGREEAAAQNRQVWRLLMDLLDQLYAIQSGERIAMKDLPKLLESGLNGLTVSVLPPAPEAVTVGAAGHMLTGEMDALLLMGLQDMDAGADRNDTLTDEERQLLEARCGHAIGMPRGIQEALKKAQLFRLFALPEKKLFITCSRASESGESMHEAMMFSSVRRMFPNAVRKLDSSRPLSPQDALDRLGGKLRDAAMGSAMDPAWLGALRRLQQMEPWSRRAESILKSIGHHAEAQPLPEETARAIYPARTVSISRLEQYAACPFRHYVNYGLRPMIRDDFSFDADDRGIFYHTVLQRYAGLASEHPRWPDLEERELDQMLDQAVAPALEAWREGPLEQDAIGRVQGKEYVRTVRRACRMFTRHARESGFRRSMTEVSFGKPGSPFPPVVLQLSDGREIRLQGVIDRIDTGDVDGEVCLRVVDYKSSDRDMDPVRMKYGLQLQLMLYLLAVTRQEQHVLPGGAFYFAVKEKLMDEKDDVIREQVQDRLARKMLLRGVVLADVRVIRAMGNAIPAAMDRNGEIMRKACAFSEEQLHTLMENARKTASDLADQMERGRIDISPAVIGDWSACDTCEFRTVCGIDPKRDGRNRRTLGGNKDELWKELTGTQLED